MRTRKSWQEKLADNKGLPRVEKMPSKMVARWGAGTLLIPAPLEVDALMKRVPRGKVTTINEIRAALAKKHRATVCCPITTGIFAWIAANAAAEAAAAGRKRVTPYWRTLKSRGEINERYPGGINASRRQLRAEGHKVVKRGKSYFLPNFQESLFLPKS
jgi:alkylated DNA nucleotide flippase Atl1